MNRVAKKQQGFTIIELMLAMTFIAVLLLAIAMTVIQIGGVYGKGMMLKEVNQISRSLNDDLRRTIQTAGVLVPATDYVLTPSAANPSGGRLCLGTYSYIWNYEKTIANPADLYFAKYLAPPTGAAPKDPIRLVKVPDPGKVYCETTAPGGPAKQKDMLGTDVALSKELLKKGDRELGLHQFAVNSSASASDKATGQQLYSITYTIGTNKLTALNTTQSACLAPNLPAADPLYCHVEQFSLVIRAGGGVN